jgi:hypothetical protein
MELGDPGFRELWFFADLRGGNEYMSARWNHEAGSHDDTMCASASRRRCGL